MIAIISPAKTLDLTPADKGETSNARFPKETKTLVDHLSEKSVEEIRTLMGLSDNLASLNVRRYQDFKSRHTNTNSKPCLFSFKGDVYVGLNAETLSESHISYAQDHLRILSGMYGLLRPMDLIQPYRLEMGTRLQVNEHKNLYNFWGDKITQLLESDLKKQGDDLLINLASNEYFKSVNRKKIKANIIDIDFRDSKNGNYKVISFFAKKARGLMSRYIITNEIDKVNDLRGFDYEGYYYDSKSSTSSKLIFKREEQS